MLSANFKLVLAAVSLAASVRGWTGGHRDVHPHESHEREVRELRARNIVYNGQIASEYDYVIAGGGTAGLVLAARLSEDANATVLVLEAGDTGDAVKSSIDVPGNAYYSSLLGTSYDWGYTTVPQPSANNRALSWSRGKVLGGSSAVNGLYAVRPSELEVNAWSNLISGTGSTPWTWASLFNAMKKSEDFHPPSDEIQQEGSIQYSMDAHGTSGPVQVSYPGYIVPVVGNWTTTLEAIGIPRSPDANSGEGWGAFVATSTINPANWTRSYARSAYIDPLPPRSNLDILANATVTRLIFNGTNSEGNMTANGVEYAATRDGDRKTVSVRREVIVAGGAIGSPQILQLSGVGPKDVLDAAGVEVQHELPGVGQHLQDHLSSSVIWKTSADTAASLHQSNITNLPGGTSSPFLSFINSATAYANVTDLVGPDFASTFQSEIAANLSSAASNLVPSTDATVIEGYKAIYNVNVNSLLTSAVGQIELLLSLTGTAVGGSQSIAIQAALQHPFSQGRVYINSSDPFDKPVIDPQYLSHYADTVMLREGLKLARKLGNAAPLSTAMMSELMPGDSVSSDADWDAYVASSSGTEYHPSCSCAMLPLSQGGVVNADLKVYGLGNVRVVDASVFPIEFAAHLQMPVYGLAEQAASIIRAEWNGGEVPSASATGTATVSASSTASTTTSTTKKSAGGRLSTSHVTISVIIVAAMAALL
ncbi:alcohol oxidase [Punctularia strigosozonata HHB-11173 SS5]|uniref:alcohol oxidase n=1 Tax=Punctularia strigosozonata (strain HHB-11173) TaxID=741275 RepID=UPI00044173CB|nr:alcohol oxidase [Punctularia strigosozonata HHB-11173 SS5]EIN06345.1 alcohol oxidase [Punctularia strigosozonata HHB-11173 SS5]